MKQTGESPLAGCRILVADDEFLNVMLLEELLGDLDVSVVGPVSTVGEIVPTADEEHPDAAVLDVNLRGETVYAAAAQLRQRNIPVIFVSGYDVLPKCPPELIETPRLRKPISIDTLAKALEQLMASHRGS